ncbi:MAG: dTMP kinase [Brevinematales bacterium]|nr:dTMP kinase [Brevinematales bacterium]
MFITFEGIEGCGKSTQARLLSERMQKEGYSVLFTHEPGDSPIGKHLRKILLSEPMDSLTELLLFLADRREHLVHLIQPALSQHTVVICDRYIYSTLAYQVYGRGIKKYLVDTIHQEILDNTFPDRVYLLDLDVSQALQRKKHHAFDRIEKESYEFHQRVREGFLELAKDNPSARILDATLPPLTIHNLIWEDIQTLFLHRRQI